MTTTQLHQRHIESQFANDPAIVETAAETGCVSVDSPEQLPESLHDPRIASFVKLPGLLFWHQPLGGGEPVPQFRPDRPVDDGPKYVFPCDVSCISVTPSMQRRLDEDAARLFKILIVEGTKQNIFAATYAPDDTVVVGIQGCWGWSSGGTAVVALDDLCHGRDVFVVFDADVSSNRKVFDAAESLNTQLSTNGATSVKYVKVPGSKTTGLDDYLAGRRAANRAEPLAQMISDALPFKKLHKPRASSALNSGGETFDFISESLGEVVEAVFESVGENHQVAKEHTLLTIAGVIEENGVGRNVRRVSTLLRAAPRIVTTVEEMDILTPDAESQFYHDIELQIGPKSSSEVHIIKDVPDDELGRARNWLARAGTAGLYASLGRGGQGINGQARIAEAMRDLAKHSDVERRVITTHTGWVDIDMTAYWVDAGGAHGPDGKITTIKARLEGSVAGLNVPGFVKGSKMSEMVASIKALLGVCDYLYDSTSWITGISGIFWALSGGYPDAVLYFVGGAGSGKTSIIGAMASMFGEKWGTGADPMASVEGTTAYLTDVTRQIHNCPLILDDARDRSSTRSQESQDEALDAVIRVGYGGGGAARGRKVKNASGEWRQSAASSNRPFVIIAGETLPNSAPQSTIERILAVEIKTATSMKATEDTFDGQSGYEHLVDISRSGALRPMVSYFLHSVARQSTNSMNGLNEGTNHGVEDLDEIRERLERARTEVAKRVLAEHWPKRTPASPRVEQVTATFIAGASILFEQIMDFREELQMTQAEIESLEYEWHSKIVAAAVSHASTNLASGSEVEKIFDIVHGAIASTRYCIGEPSSSQTRIGVWFEPEIDGIKTECIALFPSEIERLPGMLPHLQSRLSAVLIRGQKNRPKYSVKVDGNTVQSFAIRKSDFNKGAEDFDEFNFVPVGAHTNKKEG